LTGTSMTSDKEQAVREIRELQKKAKTQDHGYTWADAMVILSHLETLLTATETLIALEGKVAGTD
jgi:hypothetical protein